MPRNSKASHACAGTARTGAGRGQEAPPAWLPCLALGLSGSGICHRVGRGNGRVLARARRSGTASLVILQTNDSRNVRDDSGTSDHNYWTYPHRILV